MEEKREGVKKTKRKREGGEVERRRERGGKILLLIFTRTKLYYTHSQQFALSLNSI